jgi:hypothetical protein
MPLSFAVSISEYIEAARRRALGRIVVEAEAAIFEAVSQRTPARPHIRSTASRYAQTAAAAAISTGGVSSLNVPDVVHSEHFRVVTPRRHRGAEGWTRCQ